MYKMLISLLIAAAVLSGCGSDDDTESALSSVCDSQTQVLEDVAALATADPDETTGDDLTSMVDSLQSSVEQLQEAGDELDEQDAENVKTAFDSLKDSLGELSDVPLADLDAAAAATIGAAIVDFQTSYREAYANSSCTADTE